MLAKGDRTVSRLAGKRAIVTGGERGIGRAIAIGMAREGADVAVMHHPIRADLARETTSRIIDTGRQGIAIPVDISSEVQIAEGLSTVRRDMGTPHILVNNAATLSRRPVLEMTVEDFDQVVAVNLRGTFLVSMGVARIMIEERARGSILNISSTSAERAAYGLVHYQASKGGVLMLTRGLALELAEFGIRVNSIAPGTTVTDLNRDLLSDSETRQSRLATIPIGRFGVPEDHVGAAVFLTSDEASFVTGTTLTIDGGITVR